MQNQRRLEVYLKVWESMKTGIQKEQQTVNHVHVSVAGDICHLLQEAGKTEDLQTFVEGIDPTDLNIFKWNEDFLRSLVHITMERKQYDKVIRLIEEGHFVHYKDEMLRVWDEAHYKAKEEGTGKSLTPVMRFRIRQRNLPPDNILPEGGVRRSTLLPFKAKRVLQQWMKDHSNYPYPTKQEKEVLEKLTGLTLTQVTSWFSNSRRRKKLRKERGETTDAQPSSMQNHMQAEYVTEEDGTKNSLLQTVDHEETVGQSSFSARSSSPDLEPLGSDYRNPSPCHPTESLSHSIDAILSNPRPASCPPFPGWHYKNKTCTPWGKSNMATISKSCSFLGQNSGVERSSGYEPARHTEDDPSFLSHNSRVERSSGYEPARHTEDGPSFLSHNSRVERSSGYEPARHTEDGPSFLSHNSRVERSSSYEPARHIEHGPSAHREGDIGFLGSMCNDLMQNNQESVAVPHISTRTLESRGSVAPRPVYEKQGTHDCQSPVHNTLEQINQESAASTGILQRTGSMAPGPVFDNYVPNGYQVHMHNASDQDYQESAALPGLSTGSLQRVESTVPGPVCENHEPHGYLGHNALDQNYQESVAVPGLNAELLEWGESITPVFTYEENGGQVSPWYVTENHSYTYRVLQGLQQRRKETSFTTEQLTLKVATQQSSQGHSMHNVILSEVENWTVSSTKRITNSYNMNQMSSCQQGVSVPTPNKRPQLAAFHAPNQWESLGPDGQLYQQGVPSPPTNGFNINQISSCQHGVTVPTPNKRPQLGAFHVHKQWKSLCSDGQLSQQGIQTPNKGPQLEVFHESKQWESLATDGQRGVPSPPSNKGPQLGVFHESKQWESLATDGQRGVPSPPSNKEPQLGVFHEDNLWEMLGTGGQMSQQGVSSQQPNTGPQLGAFHKPKQWEDLGKDGHLSQREVPNQPPTKGPQLGAFHGPNQWESLGTDGQMSQRGITSSPPNKGPQLGAFHELNQGKSLGTDDQVSQRGVPSPPPNKGPQLVHEHNQGERLSTDDQMSQRGVPSPPPNNGPQLEVFHELNQWERLGTDLQLSQRGVPSPPTSKGPQLEVSHEHNQWESLGTDLQLSQRGVPSPPTSKGPQLEVFHEPNQCESLGTDGQLNIQGIQGLPTYDHQEAMNNSNQLEGISTDSPLSLHFPVESACESSKDMAVKTDLQSKTLEAQLINKGLPNDVLFLKSLGPDCCRESPQANIDGLQSYREDCHTVTSPTSLDSHTETPPVTLDILQSCREDNLPETIAVLPDWGPPTRFQIRKRLNYDSLSSATDHAKTVCDQEAPPSEESNENIQPERLFPHATVPDRDQYPHSHVTYPQENAPEFPSPAKRIKTSSTQSNEERLEIAKVLMEMSQIVKICSKVKCYNLLESDKHRPDENAPGFL